MDGYAASAYDMANLGPQNGDLLLLLLIAFGVGALFGKIMLAPKARGHSHASGTLALPAAHSVLPAARMDDLKEIPGIGPKVEAALHAGGIRTFGDLARSSREHIEEILRDAGHDAVGVRSWPIIAALLAAKHYSSDRLR